MYEQATQGPGSTKPQYPALDVARVGYPAPPAAESEVQAVIAGCFDVATWLQTSTANLVRESLVPVLGSAQPQQAAQGTPLLPLGSPLAQQLQALQFRLEECRSNIVEINQRLAL